MKKAKRAISILMCAALLLGLLPTLALAEDPTFVPGVSVDSRGMAFSVTGATKNEQGVYVINDDTVTVTITKNDNYHGIKVRSYGDGQDPNAAAWSFLKLESGVYEITDDTKFYEIEVFDWQPPLYDNEFVVGYDPSDNFTVQLNGETVGAWGDVKTFTAGDLPLTITTSETPYKVVVRPNGSDEIELQRNEADNSYTYHPTTINAGFELIVYRTEAEYNFDTIPCDWENQFIAEYQMRYDGCGNTAGSVSYDVTPAASVSYGEWTRLVLAKDTATVKLTITAQEGYVYEVWANGQDVTESVAEDVYTWTVGENSDVRPEIVFRSESDPGPGGGNTLSIEISGSTSVSEGSFVYDHGTARVMFVRGENGEGAYDGTNSQIELSDDVTAVKIILNADDGYEGVLRTGGNNPPVPEPDVNGSESTYILERSALEGAGNFVFFGIEFTGESGEDGPDPEPDWHTVSWSGGNVTVENGTVLAERVHLGDKTFTVHEAESNESDSDNIFPIEDIISEEGQEGLGDYGLGYGDTDLFISNDVIESVSIDFKFVPTYGYQLSDILTNETDSLLSGFTASASEISTFNFVVLPDGGNVHFNVVFAAAEDIIDVTGSADVSGASIADGQNATNSGNLKLTVADLAENVVSDELKARAGESALYLDMNLYQVVSKGGENGNWQNQLENLDGTITITLNVPAPASGSTYFVIREHGEGAGATYDRIEVTFAPDANDPTTGTITFQTDKFSNYALAQEAATPSVPDDTPSTPSVPDDTPSTPSNSTSTTTNPDGSTTTTVTDKTTGSVTETTTTQPVTDEAGTTTQTTTETVTNKDGTVTVTETVKATDTTGTTAEKVTETNAAGEITVTVEATVSEQAVTAAAGSGTPVTLPVEVAATASAETAPVIKVEVPAAAAEVKVEVPVENVTPGTVVVLVKEDGTEEIVKATTMGENGVVVSLDGSATVKIVDNSRVFADVQPLDHWADEAVTYVAAREIFSGTGADTFEPETEMTRAMLMTVLARFEGEDTTGGATWYEKGMAWAVATGVSDGTNPNASVTREQMVVMLYRYAGSPASSYELTFPDAGNVSDYAVEAMRWAVENGLINGMDGALNPQGSATRAQVAAIMMRFCENGAK